MAEKVREKRYKSVVPVLRPDGREPLAAIGGDDEHQDHKVARWLGRESFENTAAGDRLDLVEYAERVIPLDEVPVKLAEMLGRPVDDFDWFEFSGVGRLDQDKFDWFAAEFVFHCEQWLAAERAYLESVDAGGA